jgi:hypothetical protein
VRGKLLVRYSVRSLLLATGIIAIILGVATNRERRQKHIVAEINAAGGTVQYDWEIKYPGKPTSLTGPNSPASMRRIFGDHYFQAVVAVYFSEDSQFGERIPAFEQLRTVRFVGLGGTRATDADLERLAVLPLEFLDISMTEVTDLGMRHVAAFPQLRELWVGNWSAPGGGTVGDNGVMELRRLRRLERLLLNGRTITDKSLQTLQSLRTLRELNLGCTSVTDNAVEQLKRSLPNCNVSKGEY